LTIMPKPSAVPSRLSILEEVRQGARQCQRAALVLHDRLRFIAPGEHCLRDLQREFGDGVVFNDEEICRQEGSPAG
jgi:hypothetical protein